jgi:molybdopterin-containing oxidoreductase family iron-sulfur binding subunit
MSKRESYGLETKKDGAPVFWKSLEQKANPELAAQKATAEFPRDDGGSARSAGRSTPAASGGDVGLGPTGRRGFLFGGLSAALLAVEGCARRPVENILPYGKAPEYMLPGIPVHYATVRAHRGEAIGLVVENHEGRPTKVEGNEAHPHTLGGTDAITQATLLDLYDPDRSNGPRKGEKEASWAEFESLVKGKVATYAADGGAKLRILTQPSVSPTFVAMRDALKAKLPQARVHYWAPVNESAAREGAKIAFGQPVNVVCDFKPARVILALDADILQTEPGMIRTTKHFAAMRRPSSAQRLQMNRLYVIEPSYTTTGANADHRLRLPASQIGPYLLALGKELMGRPSMDMSGAASAFQTAPATVDGVPAKWIKAVADELVENRGRGIILAGSDQPAYVHALVHTLNRALGNAGSTVNYYPAFDASLPELTQDLKALVDDMDAGKVETLLILGGNPVHDAPADFKFGEKLAKVATSIHVSHTVDETASKTTWHVPRAHEFESWGDVTGLDGTTSIQQPLIAPLFGGRSDVEVLSLFAGTPTSGHDLVQAQMKRSTTTPAQFESNWKVALARGTVGGAAGRPIMPPPTVQSADVANAVPRTPPAPPASPTSLEIDFAPDPKLFDGRHANNPWLLELPDLMTKITWDNAAVISPATAKALGVESGEVVALARGGVGQIEIPVWILPGQADNVVTLNVGWGRTLVGRYGKDVGVNVYPLRTSDSLAFARGATMTKTGKTHQLVQTQEHQSMEGRPIAIDATAEEYKKTPNFGKFKTPDPKTLPLWKPVEYKDHKWGMVIDLSACTGCDACVIACQAENNIATVGKDQVFRNREMYWIRIDRYFIGDDEKDPGVALQPVACVQCEQAPCENVCPVNATTHSNEGLNDMAYNRCIGTRYCANNCPYKVRRFNYLEFQGGPPGSSVDTVYGDLPETRKMQFNPDVTVRMRGVMEKCTYCVQRIQEAKIAAKREDRAIREGDIRTACQQACPADAIVFGDLNNERSHVYQLAPVDRGYHLLSELGTHPRTTYLGKIRNPNPAMSES